MTCDIAQDKTITFNLTAADPLTPRIAAWTYQYYDMSGEGNPATMAALVNTPADATIVIPWVNNYLRREYLLAVADVLDSFDEHAAALAAYRLAIS